VKVLVTGCRYAAVVIACRRRVPFFLALGAWHPDMAGWFQRDVGRKTIDGISGSWVGGSRLVDAMVGGRAPLAALCVGRFALRFRHYRGTTGAVLGSDFAPLGTLMQLAQFVAPGNRRDCSVSGCLSGTFIYPSQNRPKIHCHDVVVCRLVGRIAWPVCGAPCWTEGPVVVTPGARAFWPRQALGGLGGGRQLVRDSVHRRQLKFWFSAACGCGLLSPGSGASLLVNL